jgi:hypothetical protein
LYTEKLFFFQLKNRLFRPEKAAYELKNYLFRAHTFRIRAQLWERGEGGGGGFKQQSSFLVIFPFKYLFLISILGLL